MDPYTSLQVHILIEKLNSQFQQFGFEFHPFLVSWYNAKVSSVFELKYNPETLSILVTSTPSMFERMFLPFLRTKLDPSCTRDPIDQAVQEKLGEMKYILTENVTEIIYDFELQPNRAPKILMQTAGHISGAAYYYQRSDVPAHTWGNEENIYGVSMHPKFGGWFAFRAVAILNISAPDLLPRLPSDCVKSNERKIELLNRFNKQWQDWTYRDMSDEIVEKYSDKQRLYFGTEPKYRGEVVKQMVGEGVGQDCNTKPII